MYPTHAKTHNITHANTCKVPYGKVDTKQHMLEGSEMVVVARGTEVECDGDGRGMGGGLPSSWSEPPPCPALHSLQ